MDYYKVVENSLRLVICSYSHINLPNRVHHLVFGIQGAKTPSVEELGGVHCCTLRESETLINYIISDNTRANIFAKFVK